MIKYGDLKNAYDIYNNGVWAGYVQDIKDYMGDVSDRGNELFKKNESWRTNVASSLNQEMVDSMYAHVIDNSSEFEVWNGGGENDKKAKPEVVKKWLNYVYQESNSDDELNDMIKDAIQHGTSYGKVVWKKGDREVEYFDGVSRKTIKLFNIDMPGIQYKNPFSIMVDPAAKSLSSARWIAERIFITLDEVWDNYNLFLSNKYQTKEKFLKDLEKKQITTSNMGVIEREDLSLFKNSALLDINTDQENITLNLTPDDKAYEVIEVYNKNRTVQVFISGVEIFNDISYYPFNDYPYFAITYDKLTGTFLGLGLGHKLRDPQALTNSMLNLHFDNSKLAGTPAFQRVTTPGQIMFDGETKLSIEPMKVFNVETPDAIRPIDLKPNDTLLTDIDVIKQLAMSSVGINEMVTGVQGKVERSASGVNMLANSFKARMRPLFKSVSQAMNQVAYQWLMMMIAFSQSGKTINIRIKRDDGEYSVEDIKVDDLYGKWSIVFEISGVATSMREIEKKQFQEVVPILMSLVDPVTGVPMINVGEIIQKFIDLWGFKQGLRLSEEELLKKQQDYMVRQKQMEQELNPPEQNTEEVIAETPMQETQPTGIEEDIEGNPFEEILTTVQEPAQQANNII